MRSTQTAAERPIGPGVEDFARPIAVPTRAGGPDATDVDPRSLLGELASRRRLIDLSLLGELGERVDPAVRESPSRWAKLAGRVEEALGEELGAFASGVLPEGSPSSARSCAALLDADAGLQALVELPRLLHIALWDAWLGLVESRGEPAERGELLRRGSDFLFAYADLLSRHIAEARRRSSRRPDGAERRLAAVEAFLGGDPGALGTLDFDVERHHLALIGWGGSDPFGLARELAAALERPLLCVASPDPFSGCWAWISGARPIGASEEHLLGEFSRRGGGRLALGLEAFGPDGFRAGHRQAVRARRFAGAAGPQLVRYEDVVVESLAAENEEDARAFVAHELRGISDDSDASRRLRETLAAYFAAEYNAASAAARLGVHQQTVANRLRAVEERLGQPSVGARRVELEMALRLRASLGAGDALSA